MSDPGPFPVAFAAKRALQGAVVAGATMLVLVALGHRQEVAAHREATRVRWTDAARWEK